MGRIHMCANACVSGIGTEVFSGICNVLIAEISGSARKKIFIKPRALLLTLSLPAMPFGNRKIY